MSNYYRCLEKCINMFRLISGRQRAFWLRRRGAAVAQKVFIGPRTQVDCPWGVTIKDRVKVESDVYLKLVSVDARLTLGSHVFVGRGCEFDVSKDIEIGAHALLAPGCFITDHNHRIDRHFRIDQQSCDVGSVAIGSDSWIGAGSVVLPGVQIGDGAVIGAAAVVNRSIPAWAIAVGAPAEIVGYRKFEG